MPSLVSVAEVRERVPHAPSDDTVLQLIIDANEALLRQYDPGAFATSVTFRLSTGRKSVLLLPYRLSSITSVTEHWIFADPLNDVVLSANDFRLAPGGTAIERLMDGDHPFDGYFADEIVIVGTATDYTALRKNILIQLCALDINTTKSTGLVSQRLGDYSEQTAQTANNGPTDQKLELLAQLAPALPVFS